jgi:tetratricopeptide (TPR) repeat protein
MKRVIIVSLLILALAGFGYFLTFQRFFFWKQPPIAQPSGEIERQTPSLVFKNTRPDMKYVGDQACSACHQAQAESYRHHPMGRSFAPVAEIASQQRYGKETHNPFTALGFELLAQPRDGKVFHRQTLRDAKGQIVVEREDEVHYVLGSGSQGHAYLSERDGFLYETPISWFSQKQIWDLSPGFEELSLAGRPISENCLFCHCNRVNSIKETVNHFRKPIFDGYVIGCERCHGPGELHVQKQERGDMSEGADDSIVNPGRLPADLREAVCQQCHLIGKDRVLARGRQAYDYRPGLPLHEYWAVFVATGRLSGGSQAVGQVEQMYASRCFRASNRRLGCISCHDPHAVPPEKDKIDFYRQRCLQCHHENGCTESVNERSKTTSADNCIQCHMPRFPTADIAHTAGTDHRIRKRPDKSLQALKTLSSGQIPIVNFHQDLLDPESADAKRNLGLALVNFAIENRGLTRPTAQQALPLLEEALRADPDDVPALEARGKALGLLDRLQEARDAYDQALLISPERETLVRSAAMLASRMDDFDMAVAYWKRVQAISPWEFSNHFYLAQVYSKHREWTKLIEECQAAIRLHPGDADSHRFLVLGWIHSGEPDKARRELELAKALTPRDAPKLQRWYDELVKSQKEESSK